MLGEEISNDPNPPPSRTQIIRTVQTPLGFFVLVVLVVEVLFSVIAGFSEGSDRTYLIVGMLVLIFLLVGIVAVMAIFRPESLQGVRVKSDSPAQTQITSNVVHISKPKALCASTSQFDSLGFEKDVELLERFFRKTHVLRNLTSSALRGLLTKQKFDILHLLGFVEPKDGAFIFSPDDRLSPEGLASLVDVCGTSLIVLASCDSINLAAKVSRLTNIVAATNTMKTDDFVQWAECFYNLLSNGHPLSRAFDIARSTTNAPMVLLMKNDVAFL